MTEIEVHQKKEVVLNEELHLGWMFPAARTPEETQKEEEEEEKMAMSSRRQAPSISPLGQQ